MTPFRKHLALSIDGGGYKGVMVAKALAMAESELGRPFAQIVDLAAGTSTGSIISSAIASGLTATEVLELYRTLGREVFSRSLRSVFWCLSRYRYDNAPLRAALRRTFGERTLGELWEDERKIDVVITVRDLVENRTMFLKPWKKQYADWPLWKAVLASSAVPTYFPVVDGRYVDGGFGSYGNPSYIAAYELRFILGWDPAETTLISLGTGRSKGRLAPGEADDLRPFQWMRFILNTFLDDANDQQVHLVSRFFSELDYRRVQVETEGLEIDDPSQYDRLVTYGEELGRRLLADEFDEAPQEVPPPAP
ncbi:MAG: patatin-like phospholipase family protein [Spirochaetota bacterium]